MVKYNNNHDPYNLQRSAQEVADFEERSVYYACKIFLADHMGLENIDLTFWAFQTLAMMLTCFLIPGLTVKGPIPALLTVAALAFVNSHLWSTALFFEIPDSVTLHTGLLLLANGVIFWIIVKLLPGIEVRGVLPALAAPVVFTVCSILVGQYAPKVDWSALWSRAQNEIVKTRSYLEESRDQAKERKHDQPDARTPAPAIANH